MQKSHKVIIDIWADVTCPFCYLGEYLLGEVLDGFEYKEDVKVRWRSALLRPDWPLDKVVTWRDIVAEASPEDQLNYDRKSHILKSLAVNNGIEYNLEQALSVNSQNAARLLKWAEQYDMVMPLAQRIGKGYFSEGANTSDFDTLLQFVEEVGLCRDEAKMILGNGAYLKEVERDQELAMEKAYNFVPTFYFNDGYMLEGIVSKEKLYSSLVAAYKQV